jgi:hypothetical protein
MHRADIFPVTFICVIAILIAVIITGSILRGNDKDKCVKLGYPKAIFTSSGTYCHKIVNQTDSLYKLPR